MITFIIFCWYIFISANAGRTVFQLLNENKVTVAVLLIATPYAGYLSIPTMYKVYCWMFGLRKQPFFSTILEFMSVIDWLIVSILIIILAVVSFSAILSWLNKLLKF